MRTRLHPLDDNKRTEFVQRRMLFIRKCSSALFMFLFANCALRATVRALSRPVAPKQRTPLHSARSSYWSRRYIHDRRTFHPISKSTTFLSLDNEQSSENAAPTASSTSSPQAAAVSATDISVTTATLDNNIDDKLQVYRNKNNVRDQVVSALSGAGGIKVTAVTLRNLMNDVMLQHGMSAVSAEALGRTMICSVLMANGMQEEQILQITLKTEGPIRGVVAICSGKGEVRGYVGSPMLGNDLTLEDAVGRTGGAVQIVKNHPDWPRPYNGITAIRHADIDRDIGIYLAESEQRSCALAAAMSVTGVLCKAAGGYLIEQLPGATDEEKEKVSENLAKLVALDGGAKLPTNLMLSGRSPIDMVNLILDGLDIQPLQQIEPFLKCDCTEDRLVRALRLLPSTDVDDILAKQECVEARCEFCGTVYRLEADEVIQKLAERKSNENDAMKSD